MIEGRIVKALSGFYYVKPNDPSAAETIQCRARGVFKKRNINPLVGDQVKVELTENGEGTVMEVLPRYSELMRPPVSNVDQAVLVFSLVRPDFSYLLLDRFLVHTEFAALNAVICITKIDKEEQAVSNIRLKEIVQQYSEKGYPVVATSAVSHEGIDVVSQLLEGKTSVLAGQSGVGKSTILNLLVPGIELKTGEVSTRSGRGKHTTRHVELVPFGHSGAIVDTPGFSQLDFADMEPEDLSACFVEFRDHRCKFRGCLHLQEPGCAIREAVSTGVIAQTRYNHYVTFLEEVQEKVLRRY